MNKRIRRSAALVLGVAMLTAAPVMGQTIDPYYECAYRFVDLGTPPGVPAALGGLVFLEGDPDTLLIGGSANSSVAALYAVPVVRDAFGRITGFGAASTVYASTPNIDGGVAYAPNGALLYSRYSMNFIGQIPAGSTTTTRNDGLSPLGFTSSVGAFTVVPEGFRGAGRLKVLPFNSSTWHDAEITPDGTGTYDISAPTNSIFLGGGPEGLVYVPAGASLFPDEGILVSEYSAGRVSSYETDANGDPIPATRRTFMTGLSGAEGGTFDPITGDFLFSTFGGGNRVLVVRGFNPDCTANFNADCAVNIFDITDFLAAWNASEPSGDFNDDGSINVFDILDFLVVWNQGCDDPVEG